jgi:hypothetical protein
MARFFSVLMLTVLLSACASNVKMTRINSEQKKPNNVWVFFTVQNGEEPVAGLQAEDFQIYEDDGLVSAYESQQVIQNPEVAAVMYTMLLLDVSGSTTMSGQIELLVDAAKVFTEKVGQSQKVGVYAFDGAEKIHAIVPFTSDQGGVTGGLDGLRNWIPKDNSTNLHGGVVEGLKALRKGLDREKKPLKFGTLVVFSDGADRAARVTREEMLEEINKETYKDFELIAIGIGDEKEMENAQLDQIGRDETIVGKESGEISKAFEKVADRIEKQSKRFYLLSYCTPARKGKHKVSIRVNLEEGGEGQLDYEFNADGFGPPPTCDPNRKPTFDLEDVDRVEVDGDSKS